MLSTLPELITTASASVRCLDAETAIKELQKAGGTIIDVREPVELEACPTPQSINIPRGILEMKITDLAPEAVHPVHAHCTTGGRATRRRDNSSVWDIPR